MTDEEEAKNRWRKAEEEALEGAKGARLLIDCQRDDLFPVWCGLESTREATTPTLLSFFPPVLFSFLASSFCLFVYLFFFRVKLHLDDLQRVWRLKTLDTFESSRFKTQNVRVTTQAVIGLCQDVGVPKNNCIFS